MKYNTKIGFIIEYHVYYKVLFNNNNNDNNK